MFIFLTNKKIIIKKKPGRQRRSKKFRAVIRRQIGPVVPNMTVNAPLNDLKVNIEEAKTVNCECNLMLSSDNVTIIKITLSNEYHIHIINP